MSQHKLHINLPLEALILKLKKEGFEVDVTTHLHIQRILLLFKDEIEENPGKLKKLLCPVISRSKEEQFRFEEIFDNYYKDIAEKVQAEAVKKTVPLSEIETLLKHSRNIYSRILMGLVILLTAVLFCYGLYALRIDRTNPALDIQHTENTNGFQYSKVGDTIHYQLSSSKTKVGEELHWDLGDSTRVHDAFLTDHVYSKPGMYRVQLDRVYKFIPFSKYSTVDTVLICESRPKVSFQYQIRTDRKGGNNHCFTFLPSIDYPYPESLSYFWDFGDGATSTELNPTHEYASIGNYNVHLKVTDKNQYPEFCSYDEISTPVSVTDQDEIAAVSKHALDRANPYKEITTIKRTNSILLIFLPIIVYLLFELFLYWKRRFKPSETLTMAIKGGDKPPYEISFPNQNNKIHQEKDQHELANKLRQRIRMSSEIIDVKQTVTSTIKNSGFPILRYKFASKPPEYLFLIDKSTAIDQYALLTKYLTEALLNEGVLLETFYYRYDPRICHNEQFPEGITLEKLKDKFPDHKLILVGNGHQFLHKKKAALQAWVKEELSEWKQKVLLSTSPKEVWGYKEKIIQESIPLLSADLEGYMTILDTLQEEENVSENNVPPLPLSFRTPEEIASFLHNTPLYQWTCAIALYPRMSWEILLAIGHELSRYYTSIGEELEVNYTNLYKIGHVIKIGGGEFPEELRIQLLKQLDPTIEKVSRKALSNILNGISLPAESFLSEELETQKLYNNFILNPANKEYAGNVFYLLNKGLITDKVYREYFSKQTNALKDKTVGDYFKPVKRFSVFAFIIRFVVFCFFISIYLAILIPVLLSGHTYQERVTVEAAILNNNAVDLYEKGNSEEAKRLLIQAVALYEKDKDTNATLSLVNQIKIAYNAAVDLYEQQHYKEVIPLLESIRLSPHKVMYDAVHLNGLCAYYLKDKASALGWYNSIIAADRNYFTGVAHPNLQDLLFKKPSKNEIVQQTSDTSFIHTPYHQTPVPIDSSPVQTPKTRSGKPTVFVEKNDLYPVSTDNRLEIILIPDNVKHASCLLWQNANELLLSDSTTLEFDYATYDDDGTEHGQYKSADGIAVHLGRDESTYKGVIPPKGGDMTFIKDGKGFGIFFKIFDKRSIMLTDGKGNILSEKYFPEVYTFGKYSHVRILVYENTIEVFFNGASVLRWKGETRFLYSGIGIGASTGSADAEHRIKNVSLSTHFPIGKENIIYKWMDLNNYYETNLKSTSFIGEDFDFNKWAGTYQVQIRDDRKEGTEWIYYGKLKILYNNSNIEYSIFPGQQISEASLNQLKWGNSIKGGYLKFNETDNSIIGEIFEGEKVIRAIPWK